LFPDDFERFVKVSGICSLGRASLHLFGISVYFFLKHSNPTAQSEADENAQKFFTFKPNCSF